MEIKVANVKPPKASLDAMHIMKLAGGTCGGVLVKDYAFFKKWIKEGYNKHFIALLRAIKLYNAKLRSILRGASTRPVLPTHVYPALFFNR